MKSVKSLQLLNSFILPHAHGYMGITFVKIKIVL